MIRHIVFWKLVAEGEQAKAAAAAEMTEALEALTAIVPGVLALTVSRNVAAAPENHDIALVADFASLADLESYATHPDHVAVAPLIRERTTARACVDIEL